MNKRAHTPELESIRGLAALLIVFHHFPGWNPYLYDTNLFRMGNSMVDLFFVLSGYVMHTAYAHRLNSVSSVIGFQIMRFGRVYPLHLLFLMLFAGQEVLRYIASRHGVTSPNATALPAVSFTAFAEHLFLLQAIIPGGKNILVLNAPSWSISVEFYTYLLFGFVVLAFKHYRTYAYGIFFLIAECLLVSGFSTENDWLLRCLSGFFLGCLTAVFSASTSARAPAYAGTAMVLAIVVLNASSRFNSYSTLLTPLLTVPLILSFTLQDERSPVTGIAVLLRSRLAIWLGSISFAVYMSHSLVTWLANQVLRFGLRRPEVFVGGRITPQLSVIETCLMFAVTCGSVLLVSHWLTRFVETPWRKRFRRIGSRYMV